MSSIKKLTYLVMALVLFTSCKQGVKGGSISKDFLGADSVIALSPTSVKIKWTKLEQYRDYEVYADYQTTPIATVIFDEITVTGLQADTNYTFSVVGNGGNTGKAGADREVSVRTWPQFTGPTGITKDADDNLILNWSYDQTVEEYQIFYKKWEDPTAANTNNWETPDVVTQDTSYLFDNLEGSTRYHFVVHAKYQANEIERPTVVVTGTTPSGFPTPTYFLSSLVIGSLPYAVVNPVINAMHLATYYTTRAYRNGAPISDPLTGQGTVVFTGLTGISRGPLDKVELHFSYDNGTVNETLVVDNLDTYIKGQSDKLDLPPIQQPGEGLAKIGKAMATGDFNCDGVKDLAIGAPDIAIRTLGVKNSSAGAVYIYYSKTTGGVTSLNTNGTPELEPVDPGVDPQVITFDDLGSGNQFGYSLASGGNLNGDRLGSFPCEDLIVGAPGTGSAMTSSAYIFFGGRDGLKAPKHITDFAVNTETCDGTIEDATCNAVRLSYDHSLWPSSVLGGTYSPAPDYSSSNISGTQFGYAVSFVGDFNADGYDDIAIGAPGGDWDGVLNPLAPPPSNYLNDVGYVAIYFGSKYGLGYEYPEATGIPTGSDAKFRWLKVFPPFPQQGMRFGSSIAGGADVDGYYRVRWAAGINYGGADMVVGAPSFTYSDPTTNALLPMAGTPDAAANISPSAGGWIAPGGNYASASNRWGVNQGTTSTGAAFVYFGRAFGLTPPAAGQEDQPYRKSFWQCGKRSMLNYTQHYSCLASSNNWRILFPRNSVSTGFGNSVAMLGSPSFYNSSNSPILDPTDPNADGYAEVIVAASSGNGAVGNSSTGVLWQYFGSKYRMYEGSDFYNIQIGGDTSATGEYRDNAPFCDEFGSNDVGHLRNCAPTVIRPNSIASSAQMGRFAESIDVADMNGDTLKDLIIGAPYDTTKGTGSGAVYIFTSNPSIGLSTNYKKLYDQSGDTYDHIGWSVAAGNFDGDYIDGKQVMDIAAGVPDDEVKRFAGGSIKLFNSSGNLLPSVKSTVDLTITDDLGSQQNYGYQYARIVGDINGDGYDDALARTANYDQTGSIVNDMVVFFGSKQGLITSTYCLNHITEVFKSGMGGSSYCYPSVTSTSGITNDDILLPQLVIRPNTLPLNWIRHFHRAGDINGDGFGDIIVTTPSLSGNYEDAGHVVIYYGTRGGLQAVLPPSWAPAVNDPQIATMIFTPSHLAAAETNSSVTNYSVHPIQPGDLNGDGYGDIVLGNYGFNSEAMNVGGINQLDAFTTDLGVGGASVGADGGWVCDPSIYDYSRCVAGVSIDNHGIVFILYGSSQGLQTPSLGGTNPPGTDFSVTNNTYSIDGYDTENAMSAKPCTAGANKVCKGEYLRNPVFLNVDQGFSKLQHQFGYAVTVLDMDNDGFDDLLVSAPGYEDLSCYRTGSTRSDYGRIYVFKGSDQGVLAGPKSAYFQTYASAQACPLLDVAGANGDAALGTATVNGGSTGTLRAIQPQIADVAAGQNATNRRFGQRLVTAGDINGDGYEDVVIGSSNESIATIDNIGTAYVYYGPLCGVDNDSNLIYALENNLNKQLTFASTALSGVVYGAECFANGSVKLPPQKIYVKDTSADQYWGQTLMGGRKSKSDVNADGYDDILIGTSAYSSGTNTNLGRGVIFFGSSGGLYTDDFPNTTVVLNAQGKYNPYSLTPKWTGVGFNFFAGNVTAGDTNGDGSVDYMVPSATYDGEAPVIGIDLGTFFLFY